MGTDTFKETLEKRLQKAETEVKQYKSNDLASWYAAPLSVIHCWQQLIFRKWMNFLIN